MTTAAKRVLDTDLQLDKPPTGLREGVVPAWDREAAYEVARLLSVIADRLDSIANQLPNAGKGF